MSWIGEIVTFIPFLWLQIAPFCVAAFIYVFSLFCRNKRLAVWLLALTESLTCALTALHEEGGASNAFTYGFLLLSLILLLAPLLRLNVRKAKTVKKDLKKHTPITEEIRSIPAAPAPKAIISQESTPMPVKNSINDSVQLAHVFQVLKKLQGIKLSAGDRLETDVIYNMLTVYQAKESLSAEETRTLNNYLATLLKLMSKYSL